MACWASARPKPVEQPVMNQTGGRVAKADGTALGEVSAAFMGRSWWVNFKGRARAGHHGAAAPRPGAWGAGLGAVVRPALGGQAGDGNLPVRTSFLLMNSWMPRWPSSRP